MARALNRARQLPLLALGQTGLFARFDLAVLVDVALQGLEILVVKKCYVCPVLKNLSHLTFSFQLNLGYRA